MRLTGTHVRQGKGGVHTILWLRTLVLRLQSARVTPSCTAVSARAPSSPFLGLIGAEFEEDITRRAMTSTVVAGLDEPLARGGDGRQKFFSCAGARASVSAPRATACHCTRWSRAHRVGQEEHRRGKRRAPGEHGGAPRPSPRSAQVPIHHFWTCSGQAAMADSGVPPATRWPPPRRRRPARPAAAPSPGPSSPGPEAPKQCKHP